jgi:hypothetical protein
MRRRPMNINNVAKNMSADRNKKYIFSKGL